MKNLTIFFLIAGLWLIGLHANALTTRYVKPGCPTCSGLTWGTASSDLQAMINLSASGDQVWVAAGTYKPTAYPTGCSGCSSSRDYTFYVKNGVEIYGGFAGTETTLAQRNIAANPTTLSGDIDNNNDSVSGSGSTLSIINNTGNAYHVVLASANATTGIGVTIDGFTINGGNGNGSFGSYIVVNGNYFGRNNSGGIYIIKGTNTITNNTLSGNTEFSFGGGGGIFIIDGINSITNNTLFQNLSGFNGGGISTYNGMNTLTNNTLSGNAAGSGGGISTYNGTNTLTNNTLSGNAAINGDGGGIWIYGSSTSTNTLTNNTLLGNTATNGNGGGIYIEYDTSSGTIGTNMLTNNILSGNVAFVGGGIYTFHSTNTLINNTLSGNSAGGYGGGMIIEGGTNSLTNNTLSGNSAPNQGGIYTKGGGTNTFTNNILWGNLQGGSATVPGADYFNDPLGPSGNTFRYNLLQGNYPANSNTPYGLGNAATGNFVADPLFINAADIDGADNIHRTADDGLALRYFSPALNTGTNLTAPTTDITGAPRTNSAIDPTDIGAYEWHCPNVPILYVDASIPNSGNGKTWQFAFKTLDEALAVAHCCQGVTTIKVAQGTYKPTKKPYNGCTEMTTTDPRDKTFHLRDGLTLKGGYYTGGSVYPNPSLYITTLSGDIDNNNTLDNGNVYHVVLASAPSSGGIGVTIDGFEIKGGNANDFNYGFITVSGNAIYRFIGGGIHAISGINTFSNNTLTGNSAYSGGGILTASGTNTITKNTLSGNSAAYGGGGIATNNGTINLTKNTLIGNSADTGGGIYTEFGTNILTNNVLAGNSAISAGGGIYTDDCTNTLTNNTLYGNSTSGDGGGICTLLGTNTLMNNIFWGNLKAGSASVQGGDYYASGSNGNTVQHNIFSWGYPANTSSPYGIGTTATGNYFSVNPNFFNPGDIDGADNKHRTKDDGLRLQKNSIAINKGTLSGAPLTDITGFTRIPNPDLGAYERWCYTCPVIATHKTVSFYYNSYTIYLEEGTSPYLITWDNTGNVSYSIDTTQYGTTITILYDNNATWVCTISNINNGTEPDLIFSNSDDPTTDPIISISSYLITSQAVDIANGAIDISVNNDCADGQISYSWSGPSDFTATTQDISGLLSGWYVVEITGCNGEETSGVYWVPLQIRGRGKQAEKEQLTAYPNPFTQTATIAFTLPETTEIVLKVYSIDGREVAQLFSGSAEAGQSYTVEFDGSGLAAGIYIVSLTSQTGEQQRYRLVLTN